MPPKRITVTPVGQGNISVFFKKAATTPAANPAVNTAAATKAVAPSIEPDNEIQRFYNSLTEKEKIAHRIAVEKLGTSYDVSRTHGFLALRK